MAYPRTGCSATAARMRSTATLAAGSVGARSSISSAAVLSGPRPATAGSIECVGVRCGAHHGMQFTEAAAGTWARGGLFAAATLARRQPLRKSSFRPPSTMQRRAQTIPAVAAALNDVDLDNRGRPAAENTTSAHPKPDERSRRRFDFTMYMSSVELRLAIRVALWAVTDSSC